jgi:glycosyltransferase involved in cell wall biosynthesis
MNKKVIAHKTSPLVSVIMPVYNAQSFVAEAIESILQQTYRNFELVIVDDASTDASWSIVQKYVRRSNKIKAVRLKKNVNRGGDGAGNVAFQHTNPRSKYIARIDADDIALPKRLEVQVRYMEKHADIAVLGSSVDIINDEGTVVGRKKVASKHSEIYKKYFEVHPMIHPTLMVRRDELLDEKNMYKLELNANNDYLTFSHMISQGKKFHNLSEKVLLYRVHDTNDSLANIKRTFFNTLTIRKLMVTKYGYKPALRSWFVLFAQVMALTLIPEKVLLFSYLLARGMVSPQKIFNSFFKKSGYELVTA